MDITTWLGVIGFGIASTQVMISVWRGWRVPQFRIYGASCATTRSGEIRSLGPSHLTVIAIGGAKVHRVVNWKFMVGADGGRVLRGGGCVLEQISITIPPDDVVKFDLVSEGGIVIEEAKKLRAQLFLDLGRYWERVDFSMAEMGDGAFAYFDPDNRIGKVMILRPHRWAGIRNAISKRLR